MRFEPSPSKLARQHFHTNCTRLATASLKVRSGFTITNKNIAALAAWQNEGPRRLGYAGIAKPSLEQNSTVWGRGSAAKSRPINIHTKITKNIQLAPWYKDLSPVPLTWYVDNHQCFSVMYAGPFNRVSPGSILIQHYVSVSLHRLHSNGELGNLRDCRLVVLSGRQLSFDWPRPVPITVLSPNA